MIGSACETFGNRNFRMAGPKKPWMAFFGQEPLEPVSSPLHWHICFDFMPEGDTVRKIADYLAPRLVGSRIARGRARNVVTRLDGRLVERVYCHGKHLFIQLEPELLLRSHLGMYGQWHRYEPGASWKKPARQASVELEVADCIYVLFNAKEVELMRGSGIQAKIWQTRLGPDLLDAAPNEADLMLRISEFCEPEDCVADVLLSQRVAAGIGNVYKSELLFLRGLSPQRLWGDVDPATITAMYQQGHELLNANLGGGKRQTRPSGDSLGPLWVYGRSRQPCLQCGQAVTSARVGRTHRSTYWCDACQE